MSINRGRLLHARRLSLHSLKLLDQHVGPLSQLRAGWAVGLMALGGVEPGCVPRCGALGNAVTSLALLLSIPLHTAHMDACLSVLALGSRAGDMTGLTLSPAVAVRFCTVCVQLGAFVCADPLSWDRV